MRVRFTRTVWVAVLASLTIAAVATAAADRPAASYYTPAAVQAMGERYQAMADWYLSRPAASHYTPAALKAMGERWNAVAASYEKPAAAHYTPAALKAMGERWQAVANYYATQPQQPTPFQWHDAVIGAAVAFAAVVIAAMTLALVRGHGHFGRPTLAH